MHNKLYLFILSLFVAISAAAQDIEITVKLGNGPAEYAFIFKNGSCLGNCDSLGRFVFQAGAIERGDSLMASVAGLLSDVVVYEGNARSMTLNVKSGENSQILVRFGERKGLVRISGIELHGNMIATGKPKDVLVSEIDDSSLAKADWKELKKVFVR